MSISALNTHVQPADMEAAVEFAGIIKALVSLATSEALLLDLGSKSHRIREIFDSRSSLGEEKFVSAIFEWSSMPRRMRKDLLAVSEFSDLLPPLLALGNTDMDWLDRLTLVSSLGESLSEVAKIPGDLQWEVMHFLDPVRVPLCPQWVFNPETETGALALLTNEEYDLFGANQAEGYSNIAFAVDYLKQALFAAGLNPFGDGPYAMDCFLAMVYGIYMSTVLEMRMTKEFIKILPPLVGVARRLLGVKGESKCQ